MKKLIFIFLFFSTVALSQNFTIRSLGAHGTPIDTDLFLLSSSAGALTKLSWLAAMQALDDESWIWEGTHVFEFGVTFNWTNSFTGYNTITEFATFDIRGTLLGFAGAEWLVPSSIPGTFAGIGFAGFSGSAFMIFNYGTSETDTLMTWRQSRLNKIYGTMGFETGGYTVAITQDVYASIRRTEVGDLWTDGVEVGDLVWTGDSIQVTTAGDYEIEWDLSLSGANTDHFHIAIFVNNVLQEKSGEGAIEMTSNDINSVGGHTILTIAATHWISLRMTNIVSSNDATVHTGNLNIGIK